MKTQLKTLLSTSSHSVITLTFGDMAENHKGMEKIGKMVDIGDGFHLEDLNAIADDMCQLGVEIELHNLTNSKTQPAHVLVLRNAVNILLHDPEAESKMRDEQLQLKYDKKALMYGRVVNKHTHWNLCFDTESREPDYVNGKGRIIGLNETPYLKAFTKLLEQHIGPKAHNLKIESNYYYDIQHCGIGYHGDSERRKVIGVRLGTIGIPIHFQWFYQGETLGERISIPLNPGDIYIMSEKAVGTDWNLNKIPTLRHAVGAAKFITHDGRPISKNKKNSNLGKDQANICSYFSKL